MNIENIILTIEYHNRIWYLKTYEALIIKASSRNLDKTKLDYYTEKHHILPKCIGGKDENSNYVLLTAREHIIAHMLLSKMYPENLSLCIAANKMLVLGPTTKERFEAINKTSTKLISYFREQLGLLQKGKVIPKSTRNKISESKLLGKGISPETKSVVCYDIDFTVIRIYKYQEEMLEDGFNSSRIRQALNKKQYCASGYFWEYLIDFEKEHSDKIVEYYNKLSQNELPKVDRSKERENYIRRESFLINDVSRNFSNGQRNKKKLKTNISKKSINKGKDNFQSRRIQGPDGTIYDSISECAEKNNKSKNGIKSWIYNYPEKGFKFLDNVHKSISVIDSNGKIYSSISKCAKDYGVKPDTLKNWIDNYPEKGFKYNE